MLIEPLTEPPDLTVPIPGSKSITNRAMVAATLAGGTSRLIGALDADDTQAMASVARQLGADVSDLAAGAAVTVRGTGGSFTVPEQPLDVRLSGTTARFSTPLAARAAAEIVVDGSPEMRARPMAETAVALRSLGVAVTGEQLPLSIRGPMRGGAVSLAADVSSQFASGLMLAAPGLEHGLEIALAGDVVSRPYLDMTAAVMRSFGADVSQPTPDRFRVGPTPYQATDYRIEPDASAASYFLAAAAVSGGRVRVEGLGRDALQGDVGFVDVLEQMGAEVTWEPEAVSVRGTGILRGIDVDMSQISDTAQTLAAIAPFADSPTRVTGIGFIRNKETDRVAAVVNELQRLGIDAREETDGFVIEPGQPQAAEIATYHDHRMAMSFAITGLRTAGVSINDPGCVDKTFPTFWQTLDTLRG